MRRALLLLLLHSASPAAAEPRGLVVALDAAVVRAPRAPAAVPMPLLETCARLGLRARGGLVDGLGLRDRSAAPDRMAPGTTPPWRLDPAQVLRFEARDSLAAAAAAESLARTPGVAWTEVERTRAPAMIAVAGSFPTDPLFADTRQWGLWNAGPAGVYGGRAGADIGARAAWTHTTGSARVRLALADTGVDPFHPELAGMLPDGTPRVAFARDVTQDALPVMADSFGHGTLVAGIMAARTGEGAHFDSLGIAGVCGGDGAANPGCVLVPIRITRGHTGAASSTDIARALLYAADVGARAVNLSFASPWPSRLERLVLGEALARGTVVVCAAGNRGFDRGSQPQYPAAHAADGLCVQVGASDPWDERAVFSSYGPGLDVVAPGVDIWTTFMTYPSAAGAAYNGYVAASGTSFAAPFATGTIGLLSAARPELDACDFQALLRGAAADVGTPGVDAPTGAGRLHAARALEHAGRDRALAHLVRGADTWRAVETDTLTLAESGVPLLDRLGRRALARRCEVSATFAVPDSFADSVAAWVRVSGTSTVRDGFTLPWLTPWANVERVGPRTLRVSGSAYRLVDARLDTMTIADSAGAWVPLPPERMAFALSLLGRRVPIATVPPTARHAIALLPNPARGAVRLAGAPGEPVALHDIAGRRIARLRLSGDGEAVWRGLTARGVPAPPGLYFVRAAGRPDARLVWLHTRR